MEDKMDDRKIYKRLYKLTDDELLAYFLNANIIIKERMRKRKGC